MFKNKSLLITGATGTFGTNVLEQLKRKNNLKKIIIFSRDENKQFYLQNKLSSDKKFFKKLRFFIGDVRDKERLSKAFKEVDYVLHAAALKHVLAMEYNPEECIKTNILGTQNVIDCSIEAKVKKCLLISTDKAVSPINLYGATKLCAEKLFLSANFYGMKRTIFSVLRYGNVSGSRGSLFEIMQNNNNINITSPNMTRFHITKKEAISHSINCLDRMIGGEIFIPISRSYRLSNIMKIYNNKKYKIIGKKTGEKLHECLISEAEDMNIFYEKNLYILYREQKYKKLKKIKINLPFSSNDEKNIYTYSELKKILKG